MQHISHSEDMSTLDLGISLYIVFMYVIYLHIRRGKAVYIALGIDMSGRKDVLGMYVGENESAKFWLSIMNDLKNRGVQDILIACIDGLIGFPQAIEAVFPQTEIQHCVIHYVPERSPDKSVAFSFCGAKCTENP